MGVVGYTPPIPLNRACSAAVTWLSSHTMRRIASSSSAERPPADILNIVPVVHEGQMTRLLCGFFEFRNPGAWPLLDELPDAIVLDLKESGRQNTTYLLIQLMISELEQERPGVGAAVNELAYLLFIQVVRSQIDRGVQTGLLGALSDAKIGRALNALHSDFAADWSVDRLATHVGIEPICVL